MDKKVDLEIVTTTKIQAIINGKKQTVRMWRLPAIVPEPILKHLKTYFTDVKKEVICNSRTNQEWVDYIKSIPMSQSMRSWIVSVIWWHFGGEGLTPLYEYYTTFKNLPKETTCFKDQLLQCLDMMGVSKIANELAAEREQKRDSKLKKIVSLYERKKE